MIQYVAVTDLKITTGHNVCTVHWRCSVHWRAILITLGGGDIPEYIGGRGVLNKLESYHDSLLGLSGVHWEDIQ